MEHLTERQRAVYDFLCQYLMEHGGLPREREIAEHFGLSKTAIVQTMLRLESHGAIERVGEKKRTGYRLKGHRVAGLVTA